MKVLLKSCTVIDSDSQHNMKTVDLLIIDDLISEIGENLNVEADLTIERDNLHVSIGWYDAKVNFQDPGNEVKENLQSGLKAAELGGITAVSLTPNTSPPLANKTQIEYTINKAQFSPVEIHPYGTLTEQGEGKNIAEYFDMGRSGAIGFTDGH